MNTLTRTIRIAGLITVILAALLLQIQGGLTQSATPQVFLPVIRKDATSTPTVTPTATVTSTPTATPTITNTPTKTNTPTITLTPTKTLPPVAWLPQIYKELPDPPQYVTSYYIQDESGSKLYTLGCALGVRDVSLEGKQDSLVILNFGQMWIEGGVYGVGSFTPYWHFIPLSKVEEAVRQYVSGYFNCSTGDNDSFVTIGIGTNNFGKMNTGSTNEDVLRDTMYVFGQRWAEMATRVNQWAVTYGYASQVFIGGAIDIEWAGNTSWNTPKVTRGWVDGFDSRDNNDSLVYFNFGACVGCPIVPSQTWKYSDAIPWTQEHIWYVSWGAPPAYVVPEIYRNDGYLAKQWQAVSEYGAIYKSRKIIFSGVMTQWQSCQQRPNYECTRTDGYGLDNTPEEGWLQLYTALNSDVRTLQDVLRWTTDIRWQIK